MRTRPGSTIQSCPTGECCSSIATEFRRISQHIAEIAIERHKRPVLACTDGIERFVLGAQKPFAPHGRHVVPNGLKKPQSSLADIFVEFELHAQIRRL